MPAKSQLLALEELVRVNDNRRAYSERRLAFPR